VRRTAPVERLFPAAPERVFEAYRDLRQWPAALDAVVDCDVHYDDGTHQYFTMTVSKDGSLETVRGVRIVDPGRRIELCQTEPPPGFAVMRGEWTFEPAEGGTLVSARRLFATPDESKEETASAMLETLLEANLAAFERHIARTAHHA
jgi:uncharacterized protein YndB with AHSA1/START domain